MASKKPTAFDHLKKKFSNAPVLTRFSDELPLKLDTDESNYGVGAVNSHIYPNGEESEREKLSKLRRRLLPLFSNFINICMIGNSY